MIQVSLNLKENHLLPIKQNLILRKNIQLLIFEKWRLKIFANYLKLRSRMKNIEFHSYEFSKFNSFSSSKWNHFETVSFKIASKILLSNDASKKKHAFLVRKLLIYIVNMPFL